jgi:hypothetical protein
VGVVTVVVLLLLVPSLMRKLARSLTHSLTRHTHTDAPTQSPLPHYNRVDHTGFWREVAVRTSSVAPGAMVIVKVNKKVRNSHQLAHPRVTCRFFSHVAVAILVQ